MYQLIYHKNLTTEKWSKFPFSQQLFMIANELNRLLNGIKHHQKTEELLRCIERLFELLDLTINCQSYRYKKELLRFRNLIAEQYILDPTRLSQNEKKISQLYKVILQTTSESAKLI